MYVIGEKGAARNWMTIREKIDYEAAKAWELHREHNSTIDPDIDPIGFEIERRSFEVGYLAALIAVLHDESNVFGILK